MPKPICENLVTRPSAQADYLEIGTLSADGATFTKVSVVGAGLPRESQLYYVAAEGACTIRGQDMVGTVAPEPLPEMAPTNPPPVVTTIASSPSPPIEPPSNGLGIPDWIVWVAVLVIVGGAGAAFFTQRQTRRSDKTPGQNFTVKLGGDGNDGHG